MILHRSQPYNISDIKKSSIYLTLTTEYVMNGADLMLPGVATLSGMAAKYKFIKILMMTVVDDNDNF